MSRPAVVGAIARAAASSLAQTLRRVRMLIEECRRGGPGLDGVRDSPTALQVCIRGARKWGDDADEYQREDHYNVGNRRSGLVKKQGRPDHQTPKRLLSLRSAPN